MTGFKKRKRLYLILFLNRCGHAWEGMMNGFKNGQGANRRRLRDGESTLNIEYSILYLLLLLVSHFQ